MPKRQTNSYRGALLAGLALWALLLVAWFAYRPGLSGAFLFDDWGNLPALGAHGPIDSWHAVVTYLLSGIASSTGRPVSMLSFLIDANNWPTTPEPFKYTNILIHLLNGALLTWLTLRLVRLLNVEDSTARWVALLSAGCWMLQPLLVSTTLYVVQRMAMLAATFVIVGLLCYLQGRQRLAAGRLLAGYVWMSIGAGVCGLLAALSKGNGALLPLFVFVVEYTVLQRPTSPVRLIHPPRGWTLWRSLFLYLPLGALVLYLAVRFPAMLAGYAHNRNFTLGERLLTEGRILVHYLYLLIIPHTYTAGLYNDDITVSTGLLHPWTTLPSLLLIAALLYMAWRLRRRQAALALAIFFFFSGQLLESTVIPLELYFEHRNYLPAIFLYLPLALWLAQTVRLHSRTRVAIGCLILTIFAGYTSVRATLWGEPFQQAAVWARLNPDSPRAQTTLALHLMRRDDYRRAAAVLADAARRHPDNIMIELNLLNARCQLGGVSSVNIKATQQALEHDKRGGRVAYNAIGKFIRHYSSGLCRGLGPKQLEALIEAGLDNPDATGGSRQDMLALRAELALSENRPAIALDLFERALRAAPRPDVALYGAALLGTYRYPGKGVALLDYYETLHISPPKGLNIGRLRALWFHHNDYYHRQIARLRSILAGEMTPKAKSLPARDNAR